MTISELIEQLEKFLDEEGDLAVIYYDDHFARDPCPVVEMYGRGSTGKRIEL